jgi:hypothetical protein
MSAQSIPKAKVSMVDINGKSPRGTESFWQELTFLTNQCIVICIWDDELVFRHRVAAQVVWRPGKEETPRGLGNITN